MDNQQIVIRRTEPADYGAIREIHAQPLAVRGTLQLPFPSAEDWRKRLADQPNNLFSLVACLDQDIVGNLGLFVRDQSPRRRHVGDIGMAVHDAWQGRGIGSALMQAAVDLADRWINLRRLELTVYTDNAPAIALYRKYGFEVEGRLRDFAFRDGAFIDAYAMARLRP
jgi:putative acetyltransferase